MRSSPRVSSPRAARRARVHGLTAALGTVILTIAWRSPLPPRDFGSPRPRSRRRRPLEEPAGTRTWAVPLGVWTGTVAPSAACHGATARSTSRSSSPRRRKLRVGLERDPEVEVAGRPAVATRCALSGQPNQLAVAHSGGKVDVDLTVVERQPAASSLQRVLQRQLEQRLAVGASQRPAGAPPRAAAEPASEQPLEQVVAELRPGRRRRRTPGGRRTPRSSRPALSCSCWRQLAPRRS